MMLQLNPEIWMMTPKGEGLAFLCTDYGCDHNKVFSVLLQNGDILDFDMKDCRRCENATYGLTKMPQPPEPHYP